MDNALYGALASEIDVVVEANKRTRVTLTGTGTFTVPEGVGILTVIAIGAGGAAFWEETSMGTLILAGGGGAEIAKYEYGVTPGQEIAYSVGTAAGERTTFGNVTALGGGNATEGTGQGLGGAGGGIAGGVGMSDSAAGADFTVKNGKVRRTGNFAGNVRYQYYGGGAGGNYSSASNPDENTFAGVSGVPLSPKRYGTNILRTIQGELRYVAAGGASYSPGGGLTTADGTTFQNAGAGGGQAGAWPPFDDASINTHGEGYLGVAWGENALKDFYTDMEVYYEE